MIFQLLSAVKRAIYQVLVLREIYTLEREKLLLLLHWRISGMFS